MRELYSAIIELDSESVLTVKFKNNVDVKLDEAKRLVDVSLEMVNGKMFYLLVDARDILSAMDHPSRKYIAEHKEYNRLNIAQAIVVNNMAIKLLAIAYYKLYPHDQPIRIFSDIEEARNWLLSEN